MSNTKNTLKQVYPQLQKLNDNYDISYIVYDRDGTEVENIIIQPKTILRDSDLAISKKQDTNDDIEIVDENLGQSIINQLPCRHDQPSFNIDRVSADYVDFLQELARKYDFDYELNNYDPDFPDNLDQLSSSQIETYVKTLPNYFESDIIDIAKNSIDFYNDLINKLQKE